MINSFLIYRTPLKIVSQGVLGGNPWHVTFGLLLDEFEVVG